MRFLKHIFIITILPLAAFAGGSDGSPGILKPLLFSYVPGSSDGGTGLPIEVISTSPVEVSSQNASVAGWVNMEDSSTQVKFDSISSEIVRFQIKRAHDFIEAKANESDIEELDPQLLDALDLSFQIQQFD